MFLDSSYSATPCALFNCAGWLYASNVCFHYTDICTLNSWYVFISEISESDEKDNHDPLAASAERLKKKRSRTCANGEETSDDDTGVDTCVNLGFRCVIMFPNENQKRMFNVNDF